MEKTVIGFVGAGKMASAILRGVLTQKLLEPQQIGVQDILPQALEAHRSQGVQVTEDARELAASCKYLLFAVKPQVIDDVLSQLTGCLRPEQVVISIVAGRSAGYYQSRLGDCKLVLAMPNTPLMLGYGATALARVKASEEEFAFVRRLFGGAGMVQEIPAERMSEIIPVHSSSPAFLYQFAKVTVEQAAAMGLDPQQCNQLFAQTLIGVAHMLTDTGKSHQELIDMVCSPGGTTLAALSAMEENHFSQAIAEGIRACVRRAHELAGQ